MRFQQVCVCGRRQLDDSAQFGKRRFLDRQFLQVRRQSPHALELRAQRFKAALLRARLLDLLLDRIARFLAIDPVARAHLDGLQFADRFVEQRLRLRECAAAASRRPQLARPHVEFLAHGPERADARRRFEQYLAEFVGRVEYAPAAVDEPTVVEPEHLLEEFARRAVEDGVQIVVRQFVVVGCAQRAAPAGTMKGERAGAALQHAADPQFGRRMQEVERRLQLHPEQQFRHGRPDRRLAGLVRPHDHVEILAGRRKAQRLVGELAVLDQIELADAHRLFPPRQPREQRGADLLDQRREFAGARHRQ